MTVDVLDLIKGRRSVRDFRPDAPPPEKIAGLLDAARWAPSAGNLQPWFIYVVKDQSKRNALSDAALGQAFIARAPVCFVMCGEPERSARIYGERGRSLYCIQDVAAAVQNLLLAAHAGGLGACWVGAFDTKKVQLVLDLPPSRVPLALVPCGYPAGAPERPPRRHGLEDICNFI